MTQTKYGILSEIHKNPATVPPLLEKLKQEGIEGLILNGDIGTNIIMIAHVLKEAASIGVETYVQPGSHESVAEFTIAMDYSRKYNNLVDVTKTSKIEKKNHHLLFLPGAVDGSLAGGQYLIHEKIPDGRYITLKDGLGKIKDGELQEFTLNPYLSPQMVHVTNIETIEKLVTDPERTIVFCHSPPKFGDTESGIDAAYFARGVNTVMSGEEFEAMVKQQVQKNISHLEIQAIARKNGITLRYENRGSEMLSQVFDKKGLTKAISGHFHESAHRAHDQNCNPLQENAWYTTLFFNASMADEGKAGVITVEDNKVAFKRITL